MGTNDGGPVENDCDVSSVTAHEILYSIEQGIALLFEIEPRPTELGDVVPVNEDLGVGSNEEQRRFGRTRYDTTG